MNKQFSETYQHGPESNQPQGSNIQKSIISNPHEMNTSEGGEFLDDFNRMEEQSLGNIDRSIDMDLYTNQPFTSINNETDGKLKSGNSSNDQNKIGQ